MRSSHDTIALPVVASPSIIPSGDSGADKTNIIEMNIKELLVNKGRNGEEMTAKQFANLAAEYLLQQYELAKAETTLKFGSSIGLLFNNINNLSSKSLITIGLLSAFAVDIAVFGGGATMLIAKSPMFYGMAAASLLTASLIGTSESNAARAGYTAAASALALAAAYQVASANPEYVNTWANAFTGWDGVHNAAATKAAIAADAKANLQDQVARLTEQVNHGGVGGKHVMVDGNPHNDYLVKDLATAQKAFDAAVLEASRTAADLKALGSERPSQKIGLGVATAYIGAWLTLAQLQVANIISKGPRWLKQSREEARVYKASKEMVHALEENPKRVLAKTSAVLERMKEFYLAGVLETKGEAEVKRITQTLFTNDNFEQMNEDASALFTDAIKRRDIRMIERVKRSMGGTPRHLVMT
ncbi:MAG: hypothetical protein SFW65_00550 [Alphaproteobacteria bacterium]|nr:hypothetical protein [Alphaproteobacteria bacterium]